jgi:hypothetical protein
VGDERDSCKVLIGKPEGKRPLVSPRSRCKNDRVDVKGMYVILWTLLIWHRAMNSFLLF